MSDAGTLEQLRHIGWRGDTVPAEGRRVARVVAQHRAGYELHDGEHLLGAQPAGHFLKRGLDPSERPSVGDFVEIRSGPARAYRYRATATHGAFPRGCRRTL